MDMTNVESHTEHTREPQLETLGLHEISLNQEIGPIIYKYLECSGRIE